jgi:hypothetical protein
MDSFELRRSGEDLHLSGGSFHKPLIYPAANPEAPIRLVGFLSQRHGSVLRVFNTAGELVEIQRRPGTVVIRTAVGGLAGPS